MSWFKKENKCPFTCPVLEEIIKSEAAKCGMRVQAGIIPYPAPSTDGLPWKVEILEGNTKSLNKDVGSLKREIDNVRTLLEHEMMMRRPSAMSSLLMRIEAVETRECELRTLVCRQKKRSDELEARIAELEKKSKEININIISKTEDTTVELQKGE